MGTNKDLIQEQKGGILYGHHNGKSSQTIAVKLGIEKTAVANIIKQYKETGSIQPMYKRTGRKPFIDLLMRTEFKTFVTNERHLTFSKLQTV